MLGVTARRQEGGHAARRRTVDAGSRTRFVACSTKRPVPILLRLSIFIVVALARVPLGSNQLLILARTAFLWHLPTARLLRLPLGRLSTSARTRRLSFSCSTLCHGYTSLLPRLRIGCHGEINLSGSSGPLMREIAPPHLYDAIRHRRTRLSPVKSCCSRRPHRQTRAAAVLETPPAQNVSLSSQSDWRVD